MKRHGTLAAHGRLDLLLENPAVREAFFPSGSQSFAVEPARDGDETAVLSITEKHDGASAARRPWRCEMIAGSHGVALTRREFDTLYYLIQRSGDVVGREDILNDVDDTIATQETERAFVPDRNRLRHRLSR